MSMLRRAALAALLVSIVLLPGCDVTGLLLVGVEQAGEVIFSGGVFDFGNTLTGSAISASFTIVNHGQDDVTLPGTVGISGPDSADFVVTAQPAATVAAGGSVPFTVEFTPSTVGILERAQATFATDAGIYVVNLIGVGEGSGQLYMAYEGEGWWDLYPGDTVDLYTSGGPVTQTFRINNYHETETLYLVGSPAVVITNSSDAFTLTISPTSPVDPDSFTDFEITFNAPGYGTYQETVTVRTTDPTDPEFTFTIYGEYSGGE